MSYQQLLSALRRDVLHTMRKHHQQPRVGLVSSYNKQLHAVKVQYQPEGTESGWIPVTAPAVGNQFGITSAPNIKDQVEVHFMEGEHMVGRIMTRLFSNPDQPPQINPGEHIIIHRNGGGSYWQQDGTVTHAGPKYFQTGQIGGGQSGTTSTDNNGSQTDQSNDQNQQQQQSSNIKGQQTVQFNPDGSRADTIPQGPHSRTTSGDDSVTSSGGSLSNTAQQNITHTAQQGDITHTADQGDINHNAKNGNLQRQAKKTISDETQSIEHQGATSVNGDMSVTGDSSVSGNSTVGGSSTVGSLNTTGGLSAALLAISGLSTLTGNVTMGGSGTVGGTFGIGGLTTLTGGFNAGANSTITGDLGTSGTVSCANVNVSNNATVNGTVNAGGLNSGTNINAALTVSCSNINANVNGNIVGVLDVGGDINYGGSLNNTSDKRLKKNFTAFDSVLPRTLAIPMWCFEWRESGIASFGTTAQELRKLFPEIVHGDEETETLRIEEPKLGVIALRALQEMSQTIDRLEARIEATATLVESLAP